MGIEICGITEIYIIALSARDLFRSLLDRICLACKHVQNMKFAPMKNRRKTYYVST